MDFRWLALGLLLGCGASVTVHPDGSQGGAGAGGGPDPNGGCEDLGPVDCVDACDQMFAPSCTNGAISCELPSDPDHCGCERSPYACEICQGGTEGYECQLTEQCVGSCDEVTLCGECPADGDWPSIIGACRCDCPYEYDLHCELEPGCCNTKQDCGSNLDVQCVEHVCLPAVDDACWSDADCPPDQSCVGASICPCGALCEVPSTPGSCGGEK